MSVTLYAYVCTSEARVCVVVCVCVCVCVVCVCVLLIRCYIVSDTLLVHADQWDCDVDSLIHRLHCLHILVVIHCTCCVFY